MKREKVVPDDPQPIVLSRWVGITLLLLLLAGVVYLYFYHFIKCIDGCGPYHNTSSVADLDGDGDLDVVLTYLRHETETIFWAGPTLWINQGGGKFTPRRVDFGGPSTAAGDVDGDGDADIVQMEYGATLFLNQGGEQGGNPGDFKRSHSITPLQDPHNWSTPGTVVLGDLNNDGRLDAFVGYCCAMLIERQALGDDLLPFLPWLWINTPDEKGRPMGHGYNLTSLGDLPMRPALGDLNGDGSLDVFAALLPPKPSSDYNTADRVLFNDGSGNFVDSGQRLGNASIAGAAGSAAVALGDLDGDGDLDALVGKAAGAVIWTNQGGAQGGQAGVFADSGQRLGRSPIEAAFLADLDGDGDLDALVAGKSQAAIWWNDGQAGFRDSGQRLRYTERHGLAIGDFNGDGYIDVFSAASDTEFHLWLNQGDGRLQERN
jgi:hypothetical protein